MGKKVNNLKVCWPTLLAVAIAVTLISCHEEHMANQYEKEVQIQTDIEFDEIFSKSDFLKLQDHELNEVIIPDGLDIDQTQTYETEVGFSK